MEPTDPNHLNNPVDQNLPPVHPFDPVKPFEPRVPVKKESFFDKFFSLLTGPMTTKKIMLLGGFLLFAVIVAGSSFWIGLKGQQRNTDAPPSPTPAQSVEVTPAINESPTETPSDEPTPSDINSPTATPKPTPTHTPTPTLSPTPTLTPTPSTTQITIPASPTLDGYESSDGSGAVSTDVALGRNNSTVTRGFVTFPLNSLSGKGIDQATLRMYQKSVTGNPYSVLGDLLADHLNYGTLDNSDYNASALSTSPITLSTSASTNEWREVDVTDWVRDDIANLASRGYNSQYRMRFTNDTSGDATENIADFDSGSDHIPELRIRYH